MPQCQSVLPMKSDLPLSSLPQAILDKRRVINEFLSRKDTGCVFRTEGIFFGSEPGRGNQQYWLLDMVEPKVR